MIVLAVARAFAQPGKILAAGILNYDYCAAIMSHSRGECIPRLPHAVTGLELAV